MTRRYAIRVTLESDEQMTATDELGTLTRCIEEAARNCPVALSRISVGSYSDGSSQFGILTASYNPDHDPDGHNEYPEIPHVKWTIAREEGVRVWMGVLPHELKTCLEQETQPPSIVLERNTRGYWTVFIQPDPGDDACIIRIADDRSTKILPDRYRRDVEVEST